MFVSLQGYRYTIDSFSVRKYQFGKSQVSKKWVGFLPAPTLVTIYHTLIGLKDSLAIVSVFLQPVVALSSRVRPHSDYRQSVIMVVTVLYHVPLVSVCMFAAWLASGLHRLKAEADSSRFMLEMRDFRCEYKNTTVQPLLCATCIVRRLG